MYRGTVSTYRDTYTLPKYKTIFTYINVVNKVIKELYLMNSCDFFIEDIVRPKGFILSDYILGLPIYRYRHYEYG